MRYNQAHGVRVPLFARAVVLDDASSGTRLAWCTVETLLITQGLWFGVVEALRQRHPDMGFDARTVVLTATHTHSSASGFGYHFWTNLNAPGWSEKVYEGLRDAIVEAIVEASSQLQSGRIRYAMTEVPDSEDIAFNRSWFAYNRNHDVRPVTFERRAEATDRQMHALVFEDDHGRAQGLWNWFATHGTCVHADNTLMHPDHKGLAALGLEATGLKVVMCQECCGDVTPNYRFDKRRGHTTGRYDDDLASAEHVAGVQVKHARRLIQAPEAHPVEGRLRVRMRYVDFSGALSEARFTPSGTDHRCTPARLGLAMAEGTAEGPGPLRRVRWATRGLSRVRRATQQFTHRKVDPKLPFIDLAQGTAGRLAGLWPIRWMPAVDETFAWVGKAVRKGHVHTGSWIPQTVPLHLIEIGPVALAAVPFEMTTVAGRRLRRTLLEALPHVEHVIISPYANAYVGYLTTYEEYQVQHYEAAYTLFGPHTLGALRTAMSDLAQSDRDEAVGPMPELPPAQHLTNIRFQRAWRS